MVSGKSRRKGVGEDNGCSDFFSFVFLKHYLFPSGESSRATHMAIKL